MKEPKKTHTKGNVIVQDIKVGDIHYEFEYGMAIRCEVLTLPQWDGTGYKWQSRNLQSEKIIPYAVTHEFSHYAPNLYDYEAYQGVKYV